MRFSTVLFDLDGTLTDSQKGITQTISRVVKELGHGEIPPEELVWCVGPSLRECFVNLLGEDSALADEAVRRYCRYYENGGMFQNRVFSGVEEALSELKAHGLRLGVVTGKPVVYARPILEHFGLMEYFSGVHGPCPEDEKEDKGHLLQKALEKLEVTSGDCLYVGDRASDVRGARANGLPTLAVNYGYGGEEELREAGAAFYANSPREWRRTILV